MVRKFLALLACVLAVPAFAQLQWSSYNNAGTLVTANVASGGDATYGGSVTFTIPASTQLEFLTKTFVPFTTPTAGSSGKVTFNISMSGSLTGRAFGFGLFNDSGTTSQAMGYWGDFNIGGPYFECSQRNWPQVNFMVYDSNYAMNSGKVNTGVPVAGTTYSAQIQVNNKSGLMQIGTGSSTVAAAGLVIDGSGVTQQSYATTPKSGTNVNVTTFNEFAVSFNNTTLSPVTLTLDTISLVPPNPVISVQPVGYGGSPGDSTPTTDFAVTMNVNSATPMAYQWYQATVTATNTLVNGVTANGTTISGSTTSNLTFVNAQVADSANYFVVVTNAYGSVTSSPVLLNIANSASAATITSISLTNATVIAGNGTNVTVVGGGVPAPVYFWYDNNANLIQSGASVTLALSNLQLANGGTYSVTASNYLGTASTNFTINIIVPPCISQQPSNVLVNVGDPVNFYVVEGGCAVPAPTYRWYKNGSLISGATATNYSIGSVALTDIANYTVVVSNAAGSVTSPNTKLAINSTMTGTPTLPANNGTGVCVDTYFNISFNQTPSIGNVGKVRIFDASNPGSPVDTIDLSLNNGLNVQPRSLFHGDSQVFNYYPIIITGTTATIYPHSGVLTTGKTYYVTMDPGVIVDPSAAYFVGISSTTAWQFTTKLTGPVDPASPVVAADGSADFVTVQGAVDSLPTNGPTRRVVNIRDGNYTGIVDVTKTNITFRGQSRTGTVVGYANNNNINGTTHARMAFKVNANDVVIENMTVVNTTPQGGSQSEALMIETGARRCIVNNADVNSRQDTILGNVNSSQGYFYNTLVRGNFDYVWGGANFFFTNCEIRTILGTAGPNLAAPRTDTGPGGNWPGYGGLLVSNGISFVKCQLTKETGVTGCMMADHNGTQNGLVAYIGCSIDTAGYTNADSTAQTTMLLWESGCSNLDNTVALDNSASPFIGFTQLNTGDPKLLAAQSVTNWLYGWMPALAPNIIGQPGNQSISAGQPASFTVSATGIPDPTYQWLKNGAPISGATANSYSIASAVATNAGSYAVVVSNGSDSVTSIIATLTYNNTAPVANPSTYSRPAGYPLNIPIVGNLATNWSDADGDPLALTSSISSTNAATVSYDSSYVYYTNANDVADQINYTVGDGQGGTAASVINVVVGPPPTNSIAGTVVNGNGSVTLSFVGVPDYTYLVEATLDLMPPVVWTPVSTNTADINGLWQFTDTQATNYTQRFYRSVYWP